MEFTIEDLQAPKVITNFDLFKAELIEQVGQFCVVVTEDNLQGAKKMMADLNKIKTAIKEKTKEATDKLKEPLDDIAQKVKELTAICDESRLQIANQVEVFEAKKRDLAEKLVKQLVSDLRSDKKVESKFYSFQFDDLFKISAVTEKGGLNKATKEQIEYRVAKEWSTQIMYKGRLAEAQKECLTFGIEPFTEQSLSKILLLDHAEFIDSLIAMIHSEIERNEKIKAKLQKEAEEKAKKEFQDKYNADQKRIKEEQAIEASKKIAEADKIESVSVAYRYMDNQQPHKESIQVTMPDNSKKLYEPVPAIIEAGRKHIEIEEQRAVIMDDYKQNALKSEDLLPVKLRPSSMPRIMACPSSRHAPEVEVFEKFGGNIEGVALDEFANKYFVEDFNARQSGAVFDAVQLIAEIEAKYSSEDEDDFDIHYLCWNLIKLTEPYRKHFKSVMTQVPLALKTSAIEMQGTADLYAQISDTKACILDVKAGFVAKDYSDQVKSYAMMALAQFKTLEQITVLVVYAKLNKIEVFHFKKEDARNYYDQIRETIKKEVKNVGEQCTYCPSRYECQEKQAVLRGTIAELSVVKTINFEEVHEKVQLIKKAIANYDKQFKEEVEAKGELRIGTTTYYIDKKVKDKIDLTKCLPNLLAEFEKLPEILSISETKLKELVQEKAPKGSKKVEWEAFQQNAKSAGWTTEEETSRLSQK